MNIVFLDYDGVVNSLMFQPDKEEPYFNFPHHNKVNNYQAVRWLERLCKEFDAKIVVTSTWRLEDNYKECLYNGGLSHEIEILGKTDNFGTKRIDEINRWLNEHPDVNRYVILDDERIKSKHAVKTETYNGFLWSDYEKAKLILNNIFIFEEE